MAWFSIGFLLFHPYFTLVFTSMGITFWNLRLLSLKFSTLTSRKLSPRMTHLIVHDLYRYLLHFIFQADWQNSLGQTFRFRAASCDEFSWLSTLMHSPCSALTWGNSQQHITCFLLQVQQNFSSGSKRCASSHMKHLMMWSLRHSCPLSCCSAFNEWSFTKYLGTKDSVFFRLQCHMFCPICVLHFVPVRCN